MLYFVSRQSATEGRLWPCMNIVRNVFSIPSYIIGAVLPNPAAEPLLHEKVRPFLGQRLFYFLKASVPDWLSFFTPRFCC